MRKEENKTKINLKERLKDKRERAKLELLLYGIFFIGVILFVKIAGLKNNNMEINNNTNQSFIYSLQDNYEYTTILNINDKKYEYTGKMLGNNQSITLKDDTANKNYYYMNEKYYVYENENYVLTSEEEVYPYINKRYLNMQTIKEYIKLSTENDNTYRVYLKDIFLNSESDEYITITINEGNKSIVIDYTSLLKLKDQTIEKAIVETTYTNIGNVISLEE